MYIYKGSEDRFLIKKPHTNFIFFLHCFIPEHVPQNPFVSLREKNSDTDSHAENKLTLSLFFMGGGGAR